MVRVNYFGRSASIILADSKAHLSIIAALKKIQSFEEIQAKMEQEKQTL